MAEWLQQNFFPLIESKWGTAPERDVDEAFIEADEILLQQKVRRPAGFSQAACVVLPAPACAK